MKQHLILSVLLLSLSLVLSACGGGASNKIDVTLSDFSFSPDQVEIAAGKDIAVTVTNNGKEKHEFVIFKQGLNAGDKFGPEDEDNIYWEIEADPGQTSTGTFTAPTQTGVYYVTCGLEKHMEKGMSGYVIVVK
jgi:plastocyanin